MHSVVATGNETKVDSFSWKWNANISTARVNCVGHRSVLFVFISRLNKSWDDPVLLAGLQASSILLKPSTNQSNGGHSSVVRRVGTQIRRPWVRSPGWAGWARGRGSLSVSPSQLLSRFVCARPPFVCTRRQAPKFAPTLKISYPAVVKVYGPHSRWYGHTKILHTLG